MMNGANSLHLIQEHIEKLRAPEQALVAIHVLELRHLLRTAPDLHLAYVAMAYVSAERLADLDQKEGAE